MDPSIRIISWLFLIVSVVEEIGGVCWWVTVSNAVDQPEVNGAYYLKDGVLCDGMWMWEQQDNRNYFIIYADQLANYSNPAQTIRQSGWVVATGPVLCTMTNVLVQETGYYYYPYDVPAGAWSEMNQISNSFSQNSNLQVYCSGLSAGAITGIVFGCIIGAIIIFAIVVCVVNKLCSGKKNRQRSRLNRATPTVSASLDSGPVSGATNPYNAAMPAPPTYSEVILCPPPPTYDNVFYNSSANINDK